MYSMVNEKSVIHLRNNIKFKSSLIMGSSHQIQIQDIVVIYNTTITKVGSFCNYTLVI